MSWDLISIIMIKSKRSLISSSSRSTFYVHRLIRKKRLSLHWKSKLLTSSESNYNSIQSLKICSIRYQTKIQKNKNYIKIFIIWCKQFKNSRTKIKRNQLSCNNNYCIQNNKFSSKIKKLKQLFWVLSMLPTEMSRMRTSLFAIDNLMDWTI